MVVSALLKIKFGQAQISVPKIGIPKSKAACINPWDFMSWSNNFTNTISFTVTGCNLFWLTTSKKNLMSKRKLDVYGGTGNILAKGSICCVRNGCSLNVDFSYFINFGIP